MTKTIFITGASSGIGKAVSIEFCKKGWNVIATARRISVLRKISKENSIYLGKIIPISVDITKVKKVKTIISKFVKDYGMPDIIFLNAGTNNPNSKEIVSISEVRKIFEINYFGTLNCIDAFLTFSNIKKAHTQIIVNASVAGYRGLPYAAAYCSSKAAIINFSESIFNQCQNLGFNIRLLNPGFIKTPLTDKNKFSMPMIISVDRAAKVLYKKFLFTKGFEINLPFFFCLVMKLFKIIPYSIYFKITKLMLKKL